MSKRFLPAKMVIKKRFLPAKELVFMKKRFLAPKELHPAKEFVSCQAEFSSASHISS